MSSRSVKQCMKKAKTFKRIIWITNHNCIHSKSFQWIIAKWVWVENQSFMTNEITRCNKRVRNLIRQILASTEILNNILNTQSHRSFIYFHEVHKCPSWSLIRGLERADFLQAPAPRWHRHRNKSIAPAPQPHRHRAEF